MYLRPVQSRVKFESRLIQEEMLGNNFYQPQFRRHPESSEKVLRFLIKLHPKLCGLKVPLERFPK